MGRAPWEHDFARITRRIFVRGIEIGFLFGLIAGLLFGMI